MVGQRLHDPFGEAPALMRWQDGDIGDLEEAAAIADDPAHADGFTLMHEADGKDGVRQPALRRLAGKGREARFPPELQIILHGGQTWLDAIGTVINGHSITLLCWRHPPRPTSLRQS